MGQSKEKVSILIDIEKQYILPSNLHYISHKGKYIVVSADTANWIVLENDIQVQFFKELLTNPIKKALEVFEAYRSDCIVVLREIEARKLERTEVKPVVKNRLMLFLTNACNMRCPHCYISAGIQDQNELSTSEIKVLFDKYIAFYKSGSLTLSGGEIGLRKDLEELVSYAYGLGFTISLLSNGTLWTESSVRQMSRYISRIQISIDGYNEETNASVRGRGNFQRALRTIGLFIENGIHVDVAITPMYNDDLRVNWHRYVVFVEDLWQKYGRENISVNFSQELLDGREVNLTKEQQSEYRKIMYQICCGCYDTFSDDDYPFINNMRRYKIFDTCTYGTLTITAQGDVYMCGEITSLPKCANIRTDSFEYILEQAMLSDKYAAIDNLLPCKNCSLKYICGGGCRIKYFPSMIKGDARTVDMSKVRRLYCPQSYKEKIYDQLIRTNEELYGA